jgi:lantibiotic modifying enzyme
MAKTVQRIASTERGPADPIDLGHASHVRWLESLSEARIEAESANLARAVKRTSDHLHSLPISRPQAITAIAEIRALGAESHNGGQRPLLIRFSGGQAVVYKPVSLQADCLLSTAIDGLGARSGTRALFETLDYAPLGPDYGFISFAPPSRPLSGEAAARRFFFRFGGLVAVAYALNITDMHMENVLAVGEHPVLIDLETALYRFPESIRPTDVTCTGLVEKRSGRSPFNSGLQGGGVCRKWALDLQQEGRRTTVGYRRPHYHADNRAFDGNGPLLKPARYSTDLLAGFDFAYALLSRERDWLLECLEPAADSMPVRVRHILRFTAYYVVHLFKLLQPSATSMDERSRELSSRLSSDPAAVDSPLTAIVNSETQSLLMGDVPYFWTDLECRDLRDHRGLVEPGFFESSPLDTLREQLDRLSKSDHSEQRAIFEEAIRADPLPAEP